MYNNQPPHLKYNQYFKRNVVARLALAKLLPANPPLDKPPLDKPLILFPGENDMLFCFATR
jgi:hypothetical protein